MVWEKMFRVHKITDSMSKLVALEAYEAILHCKFEYSTKLTTHRSAPVLCHFQNDSREHWT